MSLLGSKLPGHSDPTFTLKWLICFTVIAVPQVTSHFRLTSCRLFDKLPLVDMGAIMKKILLMAAALAMFAMPAKAADIRAPVYKAPVAAAPVYNWSGFYIGAHGGWGKADTDWFFPFADPFNLVAGDTTSNKADGWLAGGQVGFNWQSGPWVFGIEGTWAWSDMEEKFQSPFNVNVDFYSWADSIYTVTGRLGYAWNNWLLYGKGGFASAEIGTKIQNRVTLVSWDHGARHDGWIAGVGLEYMLTPNWIFGVEYNYMDLGTARHEGLQTNSLLTRTDIDATVQTIVGRLSYKFDWGKTPVMAKY